jgi:tetratricopeptide (TPR) repeat protein
MRRAMDHRITRLLKPVALVMATAFLGWAAYDRLSAGAPPGEKAYLAGNRAFADGDYAAAEAAYLEALEIAPGHIDALRGLARSLDREGLAERALATYDEAIAHDPSFGGTYAHRGLLLDSMGRHEEALADYMRALDLDPTIASAPHWLSSFLRDQPAPPASIAERAGYLRAELAKPEHQRVLRLPEIEARQRPGRP